MAFARWNGAAIPHAVRFDTELGAAAPELRDRIAPWRSVTVTPS